MTPAGHGITPLVECGLIRRPLTPLLGSGDAAEVPAPGRVGQANDPTPIGRLGTLPGLPVMTRRGCALVACEFAICIGELWSAISATLRQVREERWAIGSMPGCPHPGRGRRPGTRWLTRRLATKCPLCLT